MESLLEFFKIASDKTRFRIIILLAQRDFCVCEICEILNLAQPKVSKHLIKLRDTKFVIATQNGKFIRYSLNVKNETIMEFIIKILQNIKLYKQLFIDSQNITKADIALKCCLVNEVKNSEH